MIAAAISATARSAADRRPAAPALHLGAELQFQNTVMVRGGFDGGYGGFDNLNATAGAGLRFRGLGFDYAYLHHESFDATHRVSVLADF